MDLNKKLKESKDNRKFILSKFTIEDILEREYMVSAIKQWFEIWDRRMNKLIASAMTQK